MSAKAKAKLRNAKRWSDDLESASDEEQHAFEAEGVAAARAGQRRVQPKRTPNKQTGKRQSGIPPGPAPSPPGAAPRGAAPTDAGHDPGAEVDMQVDDVSGQQLEPAQSPVPPKPEIARPGRKKVSSQQNAERELLAMETAGMSSNYFNENHVTTLRCT